MSLDLLDSVTMALKEADLMPVLPLAPILHLSHTKISLKTVRFRKKLTQFSMHRGHHSW